MSSVGIDFCTSKLRVSAAQSEDWSFDLLSHLGFTQEQIDSANDYVFGRLTIEGAPHIKDKDLATKYSVSIDNVKQAYPNMTWGNRS